jgi:hypothetical protein
MEMIEFFSRVNDNVLNAQVVKSGSAYDYSSALQYVNELISTPFDIFLNHIKDELELPFVLSSDVPQFSSIASATVKYCTFMAALPPVGYTFEEIGRILQPGHTEDVWANRKFGENHVKTAELLGLSFLNEKKYYLSAVGHVFPDLSSDQQDQLLSRMVLRNPLVFNVVHKLLNGQNVTIEDEISFLSESTIKRRKNNTLIICRLIGLNKDVRVQEYLDRIK